MAAAGQADAVSEGFFIELDGVQVPCPILIERHRNHAAVFHPIALFFFVKEIVWVILQLDLVVDPFLARCAISEILEFGLR